MKAKQLFIFAALGLSIVACRSEDILTTGEPQTGTPIETPDWTEQTHGIATTPNYAVVFNQNEVLRIDLKIDAASWTTMQADLKTNIGTSTGGKPGTLVEFDPVWAPCSVFFNGTEWYYAGVRFKGNSSLSSTYKMGIGKLSFKLDFDQYEAEYPAITDQRFYGFKELSLKNNYDDKALIREKVASDLFRKFGLVSPQTSFCTVYVDYGSGAKYFGLYTLVEEVDDTVIKTQYTDGTGNLYKPDGTAASFASGKYNEAEMVKQNNLEQNDYSDVAALYSAINSATRTSDAEAWKAQLESVLDVDIFLKWLAANTTIQNWDTYGIMTHNYYLYNNKENNRLNWIPWDNNEAFQNGKQGGALSLSLDEVKSSWPLIRYIMDVPEYKLQYRNYLKQFIEEIFIPSEMNSLYNSYYQLLKEYAYAEETSYSFLKNDAEFDAAVETLKIHVTDRTNTVLDYLETNN